MLGFARKRFGQNFLVDLATINKIIHFIDPKVTDHIIEIGPGKGALTKSLLNVQQLNLIEIDRDLVKFLHNAYHKHNVYIYEQDVLNFDFSSLDANVVWKIVGNLPYNIASQIIIKVLSTSCSWHKMFFMVQKEMALRMCAVPGSTHYGRLTLIVQYFSMPKILCIVKNSNFFPQPKVDSCFVEFTVRVPDLYIKDFSTFTAVTQDAFCGRRKMIKNSLKEIFSVEELLAYGVSTTMRAENVTLQQYISLSNYLYDKQMKA